VRLELGLSKEEFNRRLDQGVLLAPSYVNSHGLRFFDDDWLTKAREIINPYRARKAKRTATETPGN
jgi:hypothetical protein